MDHFSNKVIWITGASSGIGEALVYALAKGDSKLILSARRMEELERVKSSCPANVQGNIAILPLDLAQPASLALITEAAINLFGHIDILVNNGGISQRSLVKDTGLEVDRRIMEVNYFGTIALTKYLLPHFLGRKSGHYVVISSLVGKFSTPFRSGYAASKHALHGFYDALRAELYHDHIKVTMICPGFIKTKISVNALVGTGEVLNKMDDAQANGMPAELCAQKILKAVGRGKTEVYIGGKEKFAVFLKRFFPSFFNRVVRKANVR